MEEYDIIGSYHRKSLNVASDDFMVWHVVTTQ